MSNFNEWVSHYPDPNSLRTYKVGERVASGDEQLVLETENYKQARDNEIYDANFDQWMQGVDWSAVDNMVQELVDKSAVKDKTINNIWPGRVVNENDDANSFGQFEMNGNYIGLNNELIENVAELAKVNVDIMRTQMLFHEVIHAASKHENQVSYKSFKSFYDIIKETLLKDFSVFRKAKTETMVSSGNYHLNERKIHRDKDGGIIGDQENEFFSFFNDAVVEQKSVEMLKDYAKRTGKFTAAQLTEYENNYLKNEQANPGIVYLVFIDAITEILAAYSDVDKQVLWDGLVRGQFNEKPFEDKGVQEMFAGAFYLNFLQDLSKVETSEDSLRLVIKAIEQFKQRKLK